MNRMPRNRLSRVLKNYIKRQKKFRKTYEVTYRQVKRGGTGKRGHLLENY